MPIIQSFAQLEKNYGKEGADVIIDNTQLTIFGGFAPNLSLIHISKAQMELLEGRVPEKANEVVVSEYFLSTYGTNAKIGDTVTCLLDTSDLVKPCQPVSDSGKLGFAVRWPLGRFISGNHVV